MRKKEIYGLMGSIVLVLIISLTIFGINGLNLNAVTTFNVYDTYFVVQNIYLVILIAIFLIFAVYLVRMVYLKFKNPTVNLIFMVTDIALILSFTFLISWVNSIREIQGTTDYPPLSGGSVEAIGNGWNIAYPILFGVQFILLLLLLISGIKTKRNYRPKI